MLKNILIIIITLYSLNSIAQEQLTKRDLVKILFEEIDVSNEEGENIRIKDLYNILVYYDTTGGFMGDDFRVESKFIENQYHITLPFWTSRNLNPISLEYSDITKSRIDVIKPIYDENGTMRYYRTLFVIGKEKLSRISNSTETKNWKRDEYLHTKQGECWRVKAIELEQKKICLDECHEKYILKFNEEKYEQSYQNKVTCKVLVDKTNLIKDCKIYEQEFMSHEISFRKGKWKTKENLLILIDEDESDIFMIDYKVMGNTLELFPYKNQKIILEKKDCQ